MMAFHIHCWSVFRTQFMKYSNVAVEDRIIDCNLETFSNSKVDFFFQENFPMSIH